MNIPYDRRMCRLILMAALTAGFFAADAHAGRAETVLESAKPQSEVVACLSDQISKFDHPNVAPSANGAVRLTTHIMHVTRIDMTVASGPPTTLTVRNRIKGKLKRIVEGCL